MSIQTPTQTPAQAPARPSPATAASRSPRLLNATVFGLVGAFGLLSYIGIGHGMEALWNPTGAVIIAGGIAVAALMAFRASELHAALAIAERECAVAVVFRLVYPVGTIKGLAAERGQHGL